MKKKGCFLQDDGEEGPLGPVEVTAPFTALQTFWICPKFLTTGIVGILLPETIFAWVMEHEKSLKLLKKRMCVFMLSLNTQFRNSLSQTSRCKLEEVRS